MPLREYSAREIYTATIRPTRAANIVERWKIMQVDKHSPP
jgi:hypothetical protein